MSTLEEPAINLLIVSIPEVDCKVQLEVTDTTEMWEIKNHIIKEIGEGIELVHNFGFYVANKKTKKGWFLSDWENVQNCDLDPKRETVQFIRKEKRVGVKKVNRKTKDMFFIYLRNNDVTSVKIILAQEFDPNTIEGITGETPLTISAQIKDSSEMIRTLHQSGAFLDYYNIQCLSAMHKAVQHENMEAITTLMYLGMPPSIRDSLGLTPLYHAVKEARDPEIIRYLLKKNSPLNIVDKSGNTELHQACANHSVQVVARLIQHGAEINAENNGYNSPLHLCVMAGSIKSAGFLIKKGANLEAMNSDNKTPLDLARDMHSEQFIRLLTFAGDGPGSRVLKHHISSKSMSSVYSAQNSVRSDIKSFLPKAPKSCKKSQSKNFSRMEKSADHALLTMRREYYDLPCDSGSCYSLRSLWFLRKNKIIGMTIAGPKESKTVADLATGSNSLPSFNFIESVEPNSDEETAGFKPNDFFLDINGIDVRCISKTKLIKILSRVNVVQTIKLAYLNKTFKSIDSYLTRDFQSTCSLNTRKFDRHIRPPLEFLDSYSEKKLKRSGSTEDYSNSVNLSIMNAYKNRFKSCRERDSPPGDLKRFEKTIEQISHEQSNNLLQKARQILFDYEQYKKENKPEEANQAKSSPSLEKKKSVMNFFKSSSSMKGIKNSRNCD